MLFAMLMSLAIAEGSDPNRVPWQNNVLVIPAHKLLLCVIYKSGSTAWLNVVRKMSALEYRNATNPDFSVHYPRDGLYPTKLSQFKPNDQNAMLADASWLKFVTVRDPAARLMSAWKQKIHDMNDSPEMLRKYAADLKVDPTALSNVSFRTFVQLITESLPHVNDHYKPQIEQCGLRVHLQRYVVVDITQDAMLQRTIKFLLTQLQSFSPAFDQLGDVSDALTYASSAEHITHGFDAVSQQPFDVLSRIHRAYADDYVMLRSVSTPLHRLCEKL